MQIVSSVAKMQRLAKKWQSEGVLIGFVPTMGYLHAGHLSLVKCARQAIGKNGKVIVSIYVNPTQFAPTEDLSKYPRDLKRDLKLCREAGVDVVFTPRDAEMYPGGGGTDIFPVNSPQTHTGKMPVPLPFSTYVVEEQLSRTMEGASRPTHFRGVTTVVAKLFNIVLPDMAVFGQKDFQQAAVIQRMVVDLNFPVKIVIAPTLRERDGLAMSSRNKFLSQDERRQADVLWKIIQRAKKIVTDNDTAKNLITSHSLKIEVLRLLAWHPLARIDYIEVFDPITLQPLKKISRGAHLALAVFFGKTRLIDNTKL